MVKYVRDKTFVIVQVEKRIVSLLHPVLVIPGWDQIIFYYDLADGVYTALVKIKTSCSVSEDGWGKHSSKLILQSHFAKEANILEGLPNKKHTMSAAIAVATPANLVL